MNSVENILRQRAMKAAKKLDNSEPKDVLELIYFKIGDEIYAIDANVASEVHTFTEPTSIPFTPSYICGIFHLRGRFISLVNLLDFLGIGVQSKENTRFILLLSDENMEFGISVDEVIEQKKLAKQEIQEIPSGFNLPRADLVIGVTESGIIVLDAKKIVADSAMIIHT